MVAIIQTYPLASVLIAFVVGGWCGMLVACLMRVAADADERGEIV